MTEQINEIPAATVAILPARTALCERNLGPLIIKPITGLKSKRPINASALIAFNLSTSRSIEC